jgi:superfamily II DNA or RNA helicase
MEITLRNYQKECLEKMLYKSVNFPGSYLIQMATGLGKCFAKDTEILMYDGSIKKVQDIKVNDYLMGWDNEKRKVVSLATGTEQMYEIRQNKKDSYIVNESHILSLKCTNISNTRIKYIKDINGNKYTNGDICNITVKDYIKCSPSFKHVMKGFSSDLIEFQPKNVEIDPYFIGLWLGDGTSRSLSITTPDDEIVKYIYEYAKENKLDIRTENLKNNKANIYHFTNKYKHGNIRKYFRENLFNNKHIPDEYKINSKNIRLELLAGLLDSDGYLNTIDNSTFEFVTMHEHISNDVAFICRSLGLSCRQTLKYNKEYNKNYFYCSIFGDTAIIPTKIKRKQAKNNRNKNNRVYKIEVIKKEIDNYYGFEISGNDRMFLLSDFTVVHNTVTFASFIKHITGRMLILSHRNELVKQPRKYFNCSYGIEMGPERSKGEKVISACTASLQRRLKRFSPDDFEVIIVDEAHHAAANGYKKILNYFKPKCIFGFSATPQRGDKVGIDDVFSEIIYQKDLKWGIENGFLSNITCKRVDIGYDLRGIRVGKDYNENDLSEAVNIEKANDAVVEAYNKLAIGQTVIFCCNIAHCKEIQKRIPNSRIISSEIKKKKEREKILKDFENKKYACLINCMVLTEGTDLPCIETIIIARPTMNESLHTQMVGRGTRLYEGKEKLLLIDCVGASNLEICTAPTLLGLKMENTPESEKNKIEGDLFDLENIITKIEDNPRSWIKNIKTVNLWARKNKYNTHGVNYLKKPNGDLLFNVPGRKKYLEISRPNEWGNCIFNNDGRRVSMHIQEVFDFIYKVLCEKYADYRQIWDIKSINRWKSSPATKRQIMWLYKKLGEQKDFDIEKLNKFEAANILNRLFAS